MSNATWMSDVSAAIASRPLNQLIIPGSHDSGTYDLGYIFAPGAPAWAPGGQWGLAALTGLLGGPLAIAAQAALIGVARNVSIAQERDVASQLNDGIRYLDLRVAPNPHLGGALSLLHGFWSVTVQEVLNQVHDFLVANTSEMVILDFNHFYVMTPATHVQLATMISTTLGTPQLGAPSLLAHYSANPDGITTFNAVCKVSQFQAYNARVIVLYGGDQQGGFCGDLTAYPLGTYPASTGVNSVLDGSYPFLWPRNTQDVNPTLPPAQQMPVTIVDNFMDTSDLTTMLDGLLNDFTVYYQSSMFYVSQGVIAVSPAMVISNPISGLIGIGSTISPEFVNLIYTNFQALNKKGGAFLFNILLVDAYNHCAVVPLAKLMNLVLGGVETNDLYLAWTQANTNNYYGLVNKVVYLAPQVTNYSDLFINQKAVPASQSQSGPGAFVADGETLYLAYADSSQGEIFLYYSNDAQTFTSLTQLGFLDPTLNPPAIRYEQTKCPPALAVFNGKLFVAWTGTDNRIYLADAAVGTVDRLAFAGRTPLSPRPWDNPDIEQSGCGPALCAFNGYLFVAWQGTDGNINIAWSPDGYHWTNNQQIIRDSSNNPEQCAHEPALAEFNGQLWLVWAGQSGGGLNSLPTAGVQANGSLSFGVKTEISCSGDSSQECSTSGVALGVYDDQLYAAWTFKSGPSGVATNQVCVAHSADGVTWVVFGAQPGFLSTGTPALVAFTPPTGDPN